jgi:hypothetical protein
MRRMDGASITTRRNRFKARSLAFSSLAEAVGYADRHGSDYRIESPVRKQSARRRAGRKSPPQSWLARQVA